MPTIDLPDDELAAVTAAIRGVLEGDKFPHAPRLVPLRAALARLQAAEIGKSIANISAAPKPPAGKRREAAIDTRGGRSARDHAASRSSTRGHETCTLCVRLFRGRRRSLGEGRARPPCWATGGPAAVALDTGGRSR